MKRTRQRKRVPNWEKLQKEYDKLRERQREMLPWCIEKSRYYDMSYGAFISKLGR